jgi:hypothetical protein
MAREDYGAINVISEEEREILGIGGSKKPQDEEEGLFETIGKAGDKIGETQVGKKIGTILTVIMLAILSGGANLSIISDFFDSEEEIGPIGGCLEDNATNYNAKATFDDGTCNFVVIVYGCMDPTATNYDEYATHDNGRCNILNQGNNTDNETATNETVYGCMDIEANNYNDRATEDDESCDYDDEPVECNHTQLIVYDGLSIPTVAHVGGTDTNLEDERTVNVSYDRVSENNLDIRLDMDTNCQDEEDPLRVEIGYNVFHVFPEFDDNGTFMYYAYDNSTFNQYYFQISGWAGDTHYLYTEDFLSNIEDPYEGVYFFYVDISVDWNNTDDYEYIGYFTNWPHWDNDYDENDGMRLEP